MGRQHGAEEIRHTPREVPHRRSLFEMGSPAWMFRTFLFCGILVGIIDIIGAIADSTFTVALLGKLVLFALGLAVVCTTFFGLVCLFSGVYDLRDWARRRRMRQGSEPHHP
jgi:hypothetical protein